MTDITAPMTPLAASNNTSTLASNETEQHANSKISDNTNTNANSDAKSNASKKRLPTLQKMFTIDIDMMNT